MAIYIATEAARIDLVDRGMIPDGMRYVSDCYRDADLREELESDDIDAFLLFRDWPNANVMAAGLRRAVRCELESLLSRTIEQPLTEDDVLWVSTSSSFTGWTRIAF